MKNKKQRQNLSTKSISISYRKGAITMTKNNNINNKLAIINQTNTNNNDNVQ